MGSVEWRPISEHPDEDRLLVLLWYPSEASDFDGADYSVRVGWWNRTRYDGFSGWFQQGTNHDCFEPWNIENGDVPTLWKPVGTLPSIHHGE